MPRCLQVRLTARLLLGCSVIFFPPFGLFFRPSRHHDHGPGGIDHLAIDLAGVRVRCKPRSPRQQKIPPRVPKLHPPIGLTYTGGWNNRGLHAVHYYNFEGVHDFGQDQALTKDQARGRGGRATNADSRINADVMLEVYPSTRQKSYRTGRYPVVI